MQQAEEVKEQGRSSSATSSSNDEESRGRDSEWRSTRYGERGRDSDSVKNGYNSYTSRTPPIPPIPPKRSAASIATTVEEELLKLKALMKKKT